MFCLQPVLKGLLASTSAAMTNITSCYKFYFCYAHLHPVSSIPVFPLVFSVDFSAKFGGNNTHMTEAASKPPRTDKNKLKITTTKKLLNFKSGFFIITNAGSFSK